MEHRRPRIGISSCLLGEQVRYDGGHKRDRVLTENIGPFVDWVSVCPEVEIGLPVPRPSMRLEGDAHNPRLIVTNTGEDLSEGMRRWARGRVEEWASGNLDAFIFKSKSPSSGMTGVKVYDHQGNASNTGVGLFARALMERFPLLPVEEDGHLHDIDLRENFIESIFVLARYRGILAAGRDRGALVQFHGQHKLQLLAHSPAGLKRMGQLVAAAKQLETDELFDEYGQHLLMVLRERATVPRHLNTLEHMFGYFKHELTADEKREVREVFETFRDELVPLMVPLTLIRYLSRKYRQRYLLEQTYLNPHPVELKLRNHA